MQGTSLECTLAVCLSCCSYLLALTLDHMYRIASHYQGLQGLRHILYHADVSVLLGAANGATLIVSMTTAASRGEHCLPVSSIPLIDHDQVLASYCSLMTLCSGSMIISSSCS